MVYVESFILIAKKIIKGLVLSEDGAKQAQERLHGLAGKGAAAPLRGFDAVAVGDVGAENLGHACVFALRIDKEVGLEVVLEAAEVEVARAYGAHLAVDHHGLAVEHSGRVLVKLDSGAQALGDVAFGGVREHGRVAAARYHHPHVYVRQSGCLQGLEQAVGGQEVGSLDIDTLPGRGYRLVVDELDVAPLRGGA